MNAYDLRRDLLATKKSLAVLSASIESTLATLPSEHEFEADGPRGKLSFLVKERTPHDATLLLHHKLTTQYQDQPNGLYKIMLDGEVVDALDYMRP